uniref:Nucleolar protein Dnt1-like N-terminal domain-containing protein n=1 Tax=Peronospora matthiolae TaxID=2874970 RepID=A0AAV1V0J0_9STRA
MTTAGTAMEGEMVLLVMLPEDNRVMLVQTSRAQTIEDLEVFIADEYARLFPQLPLLCRGLRIQKCVSPDLVLDRRSHSSVRQEAAHSFVDLAKNVQAGNVFQNMEQIYIVPSMKPKLKKLVMAKQTAIVAHEGQERLGAKSAQKQQQVLEKMADAVDRKPAETGTQSSESTVNKVPDGNKKVVEKERQVASETPVVNKARVKEKNASSGIVKCATKETQYAKELVAKKSNGTKKVAVEQSSEKADLKDESTKTGTEQKSVSKKTDKKKTDDVKEKKKSKSKKIVAETNEGIVKKAAKKAAPKKSENALLKKMLAARQSASDSGASLIIDSLPTSDGDVQEAPSKSERARKASEIDLSSAEVNHEPLEEPPLKKKKSVKVAETSKPAPKVINDEAVTVEKSTSKKVTAAKDKKRAVLKNNAVATDEQQSEVNDDSSTASETTQIGRKSKKKAGAKSDDVGKPVAKRAKKGESLKASVVKKTTEKAKPVVKVATPETELSADSHSPGNEVVSGEETEVVETPVSKRKANGKLKETGESKGFKKVLAETSKRIAAERNARDTWSDNSAKPVQGLKRSVKSAESTASESSVDSDHSPVVGDRVEHSPKKATLVESDSSSSSDDEELNYSQNLLADLTKDDEEDVSIVSEKGKKSRQVDKIRDKSPVYRSQDAEQSQDMPSSELTQKPQESNSVLSRSLSRNRFSLGSMPVAKLKKSSKNPFKIVKAETSSATGRPRGRPRKVELE